MSQESQYTPEMAKRICRAIATTPHGLRRICKANPDFPNPDTIYSWMIDNAEFAEWYARAKVAQADVLADDMIDVALDGSNDWVEDSKGKKRIDNECVQRSRLIVDTYKWQATILAPTKYGKKPIEIGVDESFLEKIMDKL